MVPLTIAQTIAQTVVQTFVLGIAANRFATVSEHDAARSVG